MSRRRLISNYFLFGLGAAIGLVGIWAGEVEVRDSTPGFGLFACLFALYVMWRSTTTPRYFSSSRNSNGNRSMGAYGSLLRPASLDWMFVCKNIALISFSISVIIIGLFEIASKSNSWISSSYMLGLVGSYIFTITFSITGLCLFMMAIQYIYHKLCRRNGDNDLS